MEMKRTTVMTNKKSPLEGMTITDFRSLVGDPLVVLGRALAPKVNAELKKLDTTPKVKLGPNDYCPGCGEISLWAPNLCMACRTLNNE